MMQRLAKLQHTVGSDVGMTVYFNARAVAIDIVAVNLICSLNKDLSERMVKCQTVLVWEKKSFTHDLVERQKES